MPQDLGIARATFLPLTLHEAQELGALAVELLGKANKPSSNDITT